MFCEEKTLKMLVPFSMPSEQEALQTLELSSWMMTLLLERFLLLCEEEDLLCLPEWQLSS